MAEFVLEALGRNALYAGILALPILALCFALGRRAPALQEGLLWIVLIRLVLPPDLSAPWSPAAGVEPWLQSTIASWQAAPPPSAEADLEIFRQAVANPTFASQPGNLTSDTTPDRSASSWWMQLTLLIWLGISTLAGLRLAWQLRTWRRMAHRAAEVTDPEHLATVRSWRRRLGIRPAVLLVSSPQIPAPFVTGWRRPIIALPQALSTWSPQRLEPVIAHELAHIARGDTVGVPLAAAVNALWFFHPAVRWVTGRLYQVREQLCDATVLAARCLPPQRYGASLLAVASQRSQGASSAADSGSLIGTLGRAPWPALEPGEPSNDELEHWLASYPAEHPPSSSHDSAHRQEAAKADGQTPAKVASASAISPPPPLSNEARRLKMRLENILSQRTGRRKTHPLSLFATRLGVLALALIILPMASGGEAPTPPEAPLASADAPLAPAPPAPPQEENALQAPAPTPTPIPAPAPVMLGEQPPAPPAVVAPAPGITVPAPPAAPALFLAQAPPAPPAPNAENQQELSEEERKALREEARAAREAEREARRSEQEARRGEQEKAQEARRQEIESRRAEQEARRGEQDRAREARRAESEELRRRGETRRHEIEAQRREFETRREEMETQLREDIEQQRLRLREVHEAARADMEARIEAGEIPNEEERRRIEAEIQERTTEISRRMRTQLEDRRAQIEAEAEEAHREHRERAEEHRRLSREEMRAHQARVEAEHREHRERVEKEHREHRERVEREHRKHRERVEKEHQERHQDCEDSKDCGESHVDHEEYHLDDANGRSATPRSSRSSAPRALATRAHYRQPAADRNTAEAPRLVHPTPGARLTSDFGMRRDPINGERKQHKGIDLAAPKGSVVVAAADGVVRIATENLDENTAYGTIVVLDHGGGFATLYSHLSSFDVTPGQRVAAGQQLGKVGNTGVSKGPHLHFELLQNGKPIDPSLYLEEI